MNAEGISGAGQSPALGVGNSTSSGRAPKAAETVRAAGPLWTRLLASDHWVLGLSLLYFLAVLPFAPDLANPENLELILSNMLPLLAVAIGQTVVLVTGGIDLSVTSTVALASVAGAWSMTGWGVEGLAATLIGSVFMMLVGAGIGAVNGVAITRLSMPPFMVTLATMMFVSGAAIFATESRGLPGLPESLASFAQEGVAFVPYAVALIAPLAFLMHTLLTRTLFGRWLFAVGINTRAARVSGVPVRGTVFTAYVVCGVMAAVGSILYTGRLETGSPVLGQRIFLDVIGATVIGGTSLFGGKGSILGTTFGVLFITLIDNSLNILGFSSFTVLIAKGVVILLAALLDAVRSRKLGGSR